MKVLLVFLLLLGYLAVAFSYAGAAAQNPDDDIAEAVFRFQIKHCYEKNQPKVYFLWLIRHDPSDEFMSRFKANNPKVKKRSQMTKDYADVESGERGAVLIIDTMSRVSDTEFQVEGACVAGGLNGRGFTYSVVKEEGAWIVKRSEQIWIS